MATPISFPSTTANFDLPLLFSGQAQKEFFLNQAVALVDALMAARIEQTLISPPATATEGACYRIAPTATGDWEGRDGELAVMIGGAWHFVMPKNGYRTYDAETGSLLHFDNGWHSPVEPTAASGGSTIDVEARQMLTDLVEELRNAGIFAQT